MSVRPTAHRCLQHRPRRPTATLTLVALAVALAGCARTPVTKSDVIDAVVGIGIDRPLATCVVDSLTQDELDEFGTDGDKLSEPLRAKVTRTAVECGRTIASTTTVPSTSASTTTAPVPLAT